MEWEANTVEEIIAYHIYRAICYDASDSLGEYELISRLETVSNLGTEYIDKHVSTLVKYSYKLKAEDTSGNLSEHSDSLTYKLLQSIGLWSMVPNGLEVELGSERELFWSYIPVNEMENYTINVVTQNNESLYRKTFQPGNYLGNVENWTIPVEVSLNPGQVYQWRIDTGANYHDGREMSGSESQWATFLYTGL